MFEAATVPDYTGFRPFSAIEDRIERLRQNFGKLPAWVTGTKPPQVAKKSSQKILLLSVPARTPQAEFRPAVHFKPLGATQGEKHAGLVFSLVPPGAKSQAAAIRESEVIAHVELAELAQPAELTIKQQIIKWADEQKAPFSAADVILAFPTAPAKGVSSRVSELKKSGLFQVVGDSRPALFVPVLKMRHNASS